MKLVLYISCCLLLVTACNSTKQLTNSSTVTRDSVAVSDSVAKQAVQVTNNATHRDKEIIIKDTVIEHKEREVADSLQPEEQELARTKSGKARPVYKTASKDGLTSWVRIDTNGVITFGARAEKGYTIVRGLTSVKEKTEEQTDTFTLFNEKLFTDKRQVSHTEKQTEKVVVKEKSFWGKYWGIILIAIVVVVLWVLPKLKKILL